MVMEIEPGMWQAIQEETLALEKYIADLQDNIANLQIGIGQEANAIAKQQLEFQKQQAEQELVFRREELAEHRRVTELQLATSPIDFVAYELYRRDIQEKGAAQGEKYQAEQAVAQGFDTMMAAMEAAPWGSPEHARLTREINSMYGAMRVPSGIREGEYRIQPTDGRAEYKTVEPEGYGPVAPPKTDEEIQAMMRQITGGGAGYTGEFGVDIPTTQQWSRSQFQDVSPSEMEIISSFLRAGVTPTGGGQEFSFDPQDYFREMKEGFIPYMEMPKQTSYAL